LRLGEAARQRRLVTVELIPDRVVQGDIERLRGRVDAVTIPALRNGSHDPSYPTTFQISPQQRSIAAALIVRRMGVEAVPTLTCRDCRRDEVSGVSESRKGSLENILVVYGDPFPGENRGVYEFKKSEQLIRGLSQESSRTGVSVGTITNQYAQNRDDEVSRTLRKVEAGAEFVLTNISFEADSILGYRDELLSAGLDVPLLFQVSIPHSRNNLLFVSQHFGIPLSRTVRRRLDHRSSEAGISLAAEAFEDLHREANGVHFSYLRRTRNPVPAYCALLDRLEVGAETLIAPLELGRPVAR